MDTQNNDLGSIDIFNDLFDDVIENENEDVQNEDLDNLNNENKDELNYVKNINVDDLFNENVSDLNNESNETEGSIIDSILKSKGFNPNSIKFENENGEIEEYKFSDLSKDEQMELLSSSEYSEDEIDAISFLRENNMNLSELVDVLRKEIYDELNNSQSYSVDDYSDDELFIADFKNKYGEDFTDEELKLELEKAKEHESLFEKKMSKLRSDYKNYEIAQKEEESRLKKEEELSIKNQLLNEINSTMSSFNVIHDIIELENSDKENIKKLIFDTNINGKTKFNELLEDPKNLIKAAWYLTYGDKAFKDLQSYYNSNFIKKVTTKPAVIIKNQNKNIPPKTPKRIEDIY